MLRSFLKTIRKLEVGFLRTLRGFVLQGSLVALRAQECQAREWPEVPREVGSWFLKAAIKQP